MKDTMGLSELKVRLAEVVRQVEGTGTVVTVTDRGRAVARLAPLALKQPEPAPAVANPYGSGVALPFPAAALRCLVPSSVDERQLVGVYELPSSEGGVAPRAMSISYHVCPKCCGRGRSIRRGLDGAPVPEELIDLEISGFQFLDVCDHCEGKRVVPRIDPDQLDFRDRQALLKASWLLERIEADLAPFLPQEADVEPMDDGDPGYRRNVFLDDDVPF